MSAGCIKSGPYCTFFAIVGGFWGATMKTLRLGDYPHQWPRIRQGEKNFYCVFVLFSSACCLATSLLSENQNGRESRLLLLHFSPQSPHSSQGAVYSKQGHHYAVSSERAPTGAVIKKGLEREQGLTRGVTIPLFTGSESRIAERLKSNSAPYWILIRIHNRQKSENPTSDPDPGPES